MYFLSDEDNPRKRIIAAVKTKHRQITIKECNKVSSGKAFSQMKAISPEKRATINALKTTLFK